MTSREAARPNMARHHSHQPATYQEIRKWVYEQHGFKIETCWIAHCKELCGLPVDRAPNRQSDQRVKVCPPEKQLAIKQAFRHFGMLSESQ